MNKTYDYRIYIPGGNDTALVMGIIEDSIDRKAINDKIMHRHTNIEQVGFVSLDMSSPRLLMAGGEFCGNATRSAAWFYLNGQPGELEISVSGVSKKLRAGVSKELNAWAEMPVNKHLDDITNVSDGYYLVNMEGITHLVITPEFSKEFLSDKSDIKAQAIELLNKFDLLSKPAAGVIFVGEQDSIGRYSIHPCVYVSSINTMFYETACGSGTIAAGLVFCYLDKKSINVPLIQPSGKVIHAVIDVSNGEVTSAVISGPVYSDKILYKGD